MRAACIATRVCASPVDPVLELLGRQPELVVRVLHQVLGWALEQPAQAVLVDPGDTQLHAHGQEWCADLAVELRRVGGPSTWLAVVATQERDELAREYLWPCYAALLGLRRGGPAGLLVVVAGAGDVAWARQTVACGFGALTFTPLVVTRAGLLALAG